ncbi:TetR family transcriptional regulator [Kutzneria sp. CA-103260]|uniref:TetR family transcriptional regulator n=1 Tax=Kutzneria sp. CA-103260 TaxID=2802641 RepID=UPI001BA765D3|nr:TetR family transcriptional regulator [Kutzneria sp. CA-103260]QUQ62931.1 tetR family regulatory protein [Kutzneria sp. CA-103260]
MGYDSKATKERILAAATTEFAEHGVAGARVDRIAVAAEANKRAIYDYFGDKKALFAAVLERMLSRCADAVPVEPDLAAYARKLFDYHAANPEALRLLMWEALEMGGREVPAEDVRTSEYQKRVASIDGQVPDAAMVYFFTLGLVNWGKAMPQLRRMVLGADFPQDKLIEATVAAVRTLTER